MSIKKESTSINTGEYSTPKAFKKINEVPNKKTKSRRFVPNKFEFPSYLLEPTNFGSSSPVKDKKHFKIVTNNKGESVLSISPELKTALDSIERGRTTFNKEEKLPFLTKWAKEKIPSNIRGLIKKNIGNSKSSDGYFTTSLILSKNSDNNDKKINITNKGVNILKQLKQNPDHIQNISPEVIVLLVYLFKNKNSEITLKQFTEDSGISFNKVLSILNSLDDLVQYDDIPSNTDEDNWYILNPFKSGHVDNINNPLYEIIKEQLLKEFSYNQFKKNVTYRTKSEQLHKAIKEIKYKINEINRIVDYTNKMKKELNENEDSIKYWKATEKNISNISEMINNLNNKIKKLYN